MNQNISAAETLFSAAHPDIKKITNISALILSLLFCAVGLCLLFFSSKVEDSSSASGPVLLVGGIAFLVAGGIRLMIRKRSLIYVPTGSLVKKKVLVFFDAGDLSDWGGCWRRRLFDGKAEVLPKKDGGVRMDYMGFRRTVNFRCRPVAEVMFLTLTNRHLPYSIIREKRPALS
mgnify:CR=1 FL=1